jgi:hypothetical protein
MTHSQLYRASGIALLVGAVAFVFHLTMRSLLTAGVVPTSFAAHGLWVPINSLGLAGAVLVLLALPGLYTRTASVTGRLGLLGVVLIAVAWLFFGVFLSLYAVLLLPWLATRAPALVAPSEPLPLAFTLAFAVGLLSWVAGAFLLAIPFLRGRIQPRWVGYGLIASALWMVIGNLLLSPDGPAADPVINLLSNLGPVLLLVALGPLGIRMWADNPEPVPTV